MADISDLKLRDPEDFDPSTYEPPSEVPPPLRTGSYVVKMVPGDYEKKDEDGNVLASGVSVLFGATTKGWLSATYTAEVVGQVQRNPDKTVEVTDYGKGRTLRFQRANNAPAKSGSRKGSSRFHDAIAAFLGIDGLADLKGADSQMLVDRFEECLGHTARAWVIRRRSVKKADGSYAELKNDDFDESGEATVYTDTFEVVRGEVDPNRPTDVLRAYNEIDGLYEWVD